MMLPRGVCGFIWTSHCCCHLIFTFVIIHTSILRWFLDISVFISTLPQRHIFVISHHRSTIKDMIVFHLRSEKRQITSARQVKPFRVLLQAPVFLWPRTAWMPLLDMPETL